MQQGQQGQQGFCASASPENTFKVLSQYQQESVPSA